MGRGFNIIRLVFISLLGLSQSLWASDLLKLPEQIPHKNLIPGAVQIQVSDRGMKYFETRLMHLIGNMGISLGDGYFEPINYESKKSYKFEDFPGDDQQKALAVMIRDMLSKWLVGFSLNEVRPGIQLGESGYIAQFNRFALVTDKKLLQSLGKTTGAVLAIELEVKNLSIASNFVRIFDLNNMFLGQIGADNVSIKMGEDTPVKIRLPFYVKINQLGEMEFEALKVQTNLRDSNLQIKYGNLIIPKIAIEINGHRFEFNEEQLALEIENQMPKILVQVRNTLADFAENKVPEILNKKAKEFLAGSLEEVNYMLPPGSGDNPNVTPLVWGMQLEKIQHKENLEISLKAFVEDPKNPRSRPLTGASSRGLPHFSDINNSSYDIAMSLDRGMINRILQLSFERKLYENIDIGDGKTLKLMTAPTVDFVNYAPPTPDSAFLKIKTKVKVPKGSVKGIDKLALKDNFEVAFELIAKLRKSKTQPGLEIQLFSIIERSVVLDESYIRGIGHLMKEKVKKSVREKLMEIAKEWQKTENLIPGTLPLPPEILGIKLDIRKLRLDPKGHIVMFLTYAQEQ